MPKNQRHSLCPSNMFEYLSSIHCLMAEEKKKTTTENQLQQGQITIWSTINQNCVSLHKVLILEKKNQVHKLVSSRFLVYTTVWHRALLGLHHAATESWTRPWQFFTPRGICAGCWLGAKHCSWLFLLAGDHQCWQFEFLPCISSPHPPKHLFRDPHSLGFQISPPLLCLTCLLTSAEFYPLLPIPRWILQPACLTSSLHSTGREQKSHLLVLCSRPHLRAGKPRGSPRIDTFQFMWTLPLFCFPCGARHQIFSNLPWLCLSYLFLLLHRCHSFTFFFF